MSAENFAVQTLELIEMTGRMNCSYRTVHEQTNKLLNRMFSSIDVINS